MTDKVKQEALFLISTTTKTIREICDELDIVPSMFTYALAKDEQFQVQYARARCLQADLMFDEILDIARRKSADSTEGMDKRTEIDAIKWKLSKMLPKKYGDRTQVQLSGQDPTEAPAPIIIQSTSDINLKAVPTEVLEALLKSQENVKWTGTP